MVGDESVHSLLVEPAVESAGPGIGSRVLSKETVCVIRSILHIRGHELRVFTTTEEAPCPPAQTTWSRGGLEHVMKTCNAI
jgi:hypothetical protein